MVALIASSIILLKDYFYYILFTIHTKGGIDLFKFIINFYNTILPDFIFPKLAPYLEFKITLNNPMITILNLISVFVTYFIVGFIVGWIVQKVKSKN